MPLTGFHKAIPFSKPQLGSDLVYLEGTLFRPSATRSGIASQTYHWLVNYFSSVRARGTIRSPELNLSLQ